MTQIAIPYNIKDNLMEACVVARMIFIQSPKKQTVIKDFFQQLFTMVDEKGTKLILMNEEETEVLIDACKTCLGVLAHNKEMVESLEFVLHQFSLDEKLESYLDDFKDFMKEYKLTKAQFLEYRRLILTSMYELKLGLIRFTANMDFLNVNDYQMYVRLTNKLNVLQGIVNSVFSAYHAKQGKYILIETNEIEEQCSLKLNASEINISVEILSAKTDNKTLAELYKILKK